MSEARSLYLIAHNILSDEIIALENLTFWVTASSLIKWSTNSSNNLLKLQLSLMVEFIKLLVRVPTREVKMEF